MDSVHFITMTQLEWLSVNYRKERAARLFSSRRRMILIMFQKDISYFPTIREIRDELIAAQLQKLHYDSRTWEKDDKTYHLLRDSYRKNWEFLFELADLNYDIEKPLTPKVLSTPSHNVVTYLIYLYSMESFIYDEMNRCCRNKDINQIKHFGAFAAALSYIIDNANKNRIAKLDFGPALKGTTLLYRGIKIHESEIDSAYPEGNKINLVGYTSTSRDP